jgi:hypothetical protein
MHFTGNWHSTSFRFLLFTSLYFEPLIFDFESTLGFILEVFPPNFFSILGHYYSVIYNHDGFLSSHVGIGWKGSPQIGMDDAANLPKLEEKDRR